MTDSPTALAGTPLPDLTAASHLTLTLTIITTQVELLFGAADVIRTEVTRPFKRPKTERTPAAP